MSNFSAVWRFAVFQNKTANSLDRTPPERNCWGAEGEQRGSRRAELSSPAYTSATGAMERSVQQTGGSGVSEWCEIPGHVCQSGAKGAMRIWESPKLLIIYCEKLSLKWRRPWLPAYTRSSGERWNITNGEGHKTNKSKPPPPPPSSCVTFCSVRVSVYEAASSVFSARRLNLHFST